MICPDEVLFMLCCEEGLITVSSLYISIKPTCLHCVFVFSTFTKLFAVHPLFMKEFDLSSCCHGNLHYAVPWMQTVSSCVLLLSRPCGGVLMEIPLSRNQVKAGRGFVQCWWIMLGRGRQSRDALNPCLALSLFPAFSNPARTFHPSGSSYHWRHRTDPRGRVESLERSLGQSCISCICTAKY